MYDVNKPVSASPFLENIDTVMAGIARGAFITVKDASGRINAMTLGWATAGFMWRTPVFMAPVRPSRFTHDLLETAVDFTVTVPNADTAKKELAICGTTSGRFGDKIANAGLTIINARATQSPVVQCAGEVFECRIMYKTAMNEYPGPTTDMFYATGDSHTLYFAEIVQRYHIG